VRSAPRRQRRGLRAAPKSSEIAGELPKALELRFFALRPPLNFWHRYAISMACSDTDGGLQGGSIVPVDEVGQSIPHGVLRRMHMQY
jgi:hypothetical protein